MQINFKKITSTAIVPTRGTEESAGYDLYADNDETIGIAPHSTLQIPTNIAMAIPNGYFGGIYPRSGLATKRSIRMANCVGVIDADYRGNVIIPLHNDSNELVTIEPHERVAQLIVQKYEPIEFVEVEDLDETERGEGGFGSTGTK